ncbi:MAG: extracellular solute-binding protein [Spirochaetaceae bacterium]
MRRRHNVFSILLILLVTTGSLFASGQNEVKDESVVIRMGDNLPDRNVGMGAVAEAVNKEFMKLHPEVTFEVESYQDQVYQEKIKIYATADQLPDVMKYWSFSTLLKPLVDSKIVEPLDKASFEKYPWIPGALDGNIYDGELYGIPMSADLWVVFYNKGIFDKLGLEMPTTLEGMKEVSGQLSEAGFIPAVTDGKDGWPLSISFDNIFWRVSGDYSIMADVLKGKGSFTDKVFVDAATAYQDFFLNDGIFQNDLTTTDYGAARNLFGQEQAAMYIMGAWEMGMANDENFSEDFRANVRAAKFPTAKGKESGINDLFAWYGGNYIVKADSEHKDLALEYLELYAKIHADIVWELQAGFPAQAVTPTAKDTAVAKDLLGIAADAKATSGAAALDMLTPAFKETNQKLCKDLAIGIITPEEFCAAMDAALQKAIK